MKDVIENRAEQDSDLSDNENDVDHIPLDDSEEELEEEEEDDPDEEDAVDQDDDVDEDDDEDDDTDN